MARFANLLSQRARLAWRTNKLHEYRTYPYYGVQATKSFAKLKPVIQAALAQVQHVIKDAIKIIAPMTYRERYHQSTGRDPLRCPHCQGEMTLWRIWHPTYGVIYDEAKAIKRGQYERRREHDPTERGHRHPLWATA